MRCAAAIVLLALGVSGCGAEPERPAAAPAPERAVSRTVRQGSGTQCESTLAAGASKTLSPRERRVLRAMRRSIRSHGATVLCGSDGDQAGDSGWTTYAPLSEPAP